MAKFMRLCREADENIVVLAVPDFNQQGAIHYHVTLQVDGNVRRGFNHQAYERIERLRSSARWERRPLNDLEVAEIESLRPSIVKSPALRRIERMIRRFRQQAGFARVTKIAPLFNDGQAWGNYLGGSALTFARTRDARADLKGLKGFHHSQNVPAGVVLRTSDFDVLTPGNLWWRRAMTRIGSVFGLSSYEQFIERYGRSWNYNLREVIRILSSTYGDPEFWPDSDIIELMHAVGTRNKGSR